MNTTLPGNLSTYLFQFCPDLLVYQNSMIILDREGKAVLEVVGERYGRQNRWVLIDKSRKPIYLIESGRQGKYPMVRIRQANKVVGMTSIGLKGALEGKFLFKSASRTFLIKKGEHDGDLKVVDQDGVAMDMRYLPALASRFALMIKGDKNPLLLLALGLGLSMFSVNAMREQDQRRAPEFF